MVNHCDGVRLGQPCRTLFAVGLHRCPHCGSTDFHPFGTRASDEEHPMAKITALTGPSNATVVADEPAPPEEPTVDAPGDDGEPVGDDLVAEEGDEGDGPDDATEPPVSAPVDNLGGSDEDATAEPASDAEIRQWAIDNEVDVSASGRVSKAVREAYAAAQAPVNAG